MAKKLKIALIGYGKMGKMIEQVALQKGHTIACIIDLDSTEADWKKLAKADVAIEFTQPNVAVQNIYKCFEYNVPVAVGTTGWYKQIDDVVAVCVDKKQTLFTATNFSIGVNLFFHLSKQLAKTMEYLPEYDITIEETHHTQKLDAPSGTAITAAEGIIENISRKNNWVLNEKQLIEENEIPITSYRINDVPGTHVVSYKSDIDDIEIKHTAHSRAGFAQGAVIAAEWVASKKGYFTMSDILGF
jgi:4-hydroxy-tetrahydrodipicolinate reductase